MDDSRKNWSIPTASQLNIIYKIYALCFLFFLVNVHAYIHNFFININRFSYRALIFNLYPTILSFLNPNVLPTKQSKWISEQNDYGVEI